MSFATNISGGLTALTTAVKSIRVMITGTSTGDLSGLTTTTKTSVVAAINEVKASSAGSDASTTDKGVVKLAGDLAGTAALPTVPGLALKANTSSLATVATTGSAADLTGVLGTAQLPPLAISQPTVVATQAAMLALTAQRGDVAIRTDTSKTYILATDSPATLVDWKEITASGAVISVAGKTGTVTLAKSDVGLSNVDNTADTAKPVSTAMTNALGLKADASSVYTKTEIGDVATDFVAVVAAGLA